MEIAIGIAVDSRFAHTVLDDAAAVGFQIFDVNRVSAHHGYEILEALHGVLHLFTNALEGALSDRQQPAGLYAAAHGLFLPRMRSVIRMPAMVDPVIPCPLSPTHQTPRLGFRVSDMFNAVSLKVLTSTCYDVLVAASFLNWVEADEMQEIGGLKYLQMGMPHVVKI